MSERRRELDAVIDQALPDGELEHEHPGAGSLAGRPARHARS